MGFRYNQLVASRSGPPRSPFLVTSSRHAGSMYGVNVKVELHSWKIPESMTRPGELASRDESFIWTLRASAWTDQRPTGPPAGGRVVFLRQTPTASDRPGSTEPQAPDRAPDNDRWPPGPARDRASRIRSMPHSRRAPARYATR